MNNLNTWVVPSERVHRGDVVLYLSECIYNSRGVYVPFVADHLDQAAEQYAWHMVGRAVDAASRDWRAHERDNWWCGAP